MANTYTQLMDRIRDCSHLQAVEALLDWDQETYMPQGGVVGRSEQLAMIAGLAHEKLIHDQTRRLLDAATAPDGDEAAVCNLREIRRTFDRATKIPIELVTTIARTSSLAKNAWSKARQASDFSKFSPLLGELIDLKKQVAEHIGYETEPYDALMDEFEPGATSADVEKLFAELRDRTVTLLEKLRNAPDKPDPSILHRTFREPSQRTLGRTLAEAIGFDFGRGRSDVTVHPFCTSIGGPGDVRITTRYQENFLSSALFGTLHEVGHGLYEQGLPVEHVGTPMGSAVSLGIHESQSRMWENMVGRSRTFWTYHYEYLQTLFPDALLDVPLEAFYGAINTVAPSLIRVEADELTYNLHIVLRFEIERALFTGALKPADIPARWNEMMTKGIGVTPDNDANGCLQDIHWSMGAFGYFPTYALGNLYAAQFFEQAQKDIPDLDDRMAENDHKPLLNWLRTNIHQHGQRFRAGELVERITGKPLSIDPFMNYLTAKFSEIGGVA